jgi:hypothetical protein
VVALPPSARSNGSCSCRDRNAARTTVGGEFPTCALSVAQRVPSSTMVHVSASPPTIPDGRLSRVRFWPRLCTPFARDSPSYVRRSLSRSLTSTPPRHSAAVSSSQLLRGCLPALCLGSLQGHRDHRVPRAPLPGVGVTHHQGDLTSHLRGRYPSIIALTGSCARPQPSPRLGGPSVVGSVQVVASPCWTMALPDIISAISV